MQKPSLLAVLCLLPALAFAQSPPDVRFEDPDAFSIIGTDFDARTNGFAVCFVNVNICIYPEPAAEGMSDQCQLSYKIYEINEKTNGAVDPIVLQREEYSSLSVLQKNGARFGRYPSTHYEICRNEADRTHGVLCVGPEGNESLTHCSLITEFRDKRVPYKW